MQIIKNIYIVYTYSTLAKFDRCMLTSDIHVKISRKHSELKTLFEIYSYV